MTYRYMYFSTSFLIMQIAEIVRERNGLKEKANNLSRNLHESNLESKASRYDELEMIEIIIYFTQSLIRSLSSSSLLSITLLPIRANLMILDYSLIRETIMRLVSEVGQEKKSSSQSQATINSLTRERDTLQQKIREMETETDRLKHQLAASQDAWGMTKKQLDEKQNKSVICNFRLLVDLELFRVL